MNRLTEEQIEEIYKQETGALIDDSPWALVDFSRAIEAAATEPLLQRIAEFERKSDQDDETILWQAKEIADKIDRIAELERQLEEARNQALEEAANGADALAKKWWARYCETNKHMETTREAHEDFCQLGRAIRALKGAKK